MLTIGRLEAQAPEGRVITHREQTLKIYDPFSAEEIFKNIPIPPAPALSVEDAVKSFQIAPGFRIECVASEPMVADPVMIQFDADGRMWVVEMRGYMNDLEGSDEGEPSGQIVVLEDTDGDRVMDRSTVFLDKLIMPRTVSFVEGGVLVAEPPHLWYCRDTDGDLKCDEKTEVGHYGKPGNPQHIENGLMHGLDNWMYNANSTERHKFIDGKLITETTPRRGQWGITQDDYGRLFFNFQNSSLRADLFPGQYALRNPHVLPAMRRGKTVSGVDYYVGEHSNECFPIRVNPGVTLGGNELRPDGTLRSFTIAAGPTIYRGDQFPSEYHGQAVVPESGGNLVRLDRLDSDGVHIEAVNAFGQKEFLASTDERFRPTYSLTGPDGALYIADMYKGIIEHVVFMMPYLRNQILSRGLDKPIHMGRIWRITHEGKPLGPQPSMSDDSNVELVKHLSHPNGWWRDTAQRLLVERKALDAVDDLREMAVWSENPLARIHALWTLEGLGQLDWPTISTAMGSDDPFVRAAAMRLSEPFLTGDKAQEVLARIDETSATDERLPVVLQRLLTLGAVPTTAGSQLEAKLAIMLAHRDPLFHAAAVTGLAHQELEAFERLAASDWSEADEQRVRSLEILSMAVLNEGQPERIERLLTLPQLAPWQEQAIVAGALNSELARSRWPEPLMLSAKPELLARLETMEPSDPKSPATLLHRIVTWPGDTTVHEKRPVLTPLTAEQEKRRQLGAAIYGATCFACHKENGKGQIGQAPPLADSEWANGSLEHLVRIVSNGLEGPVMVNGDRWDLKMPGLGESPLLNDERMAGVLTYVRRAWDNYGTPVEPEEVAAIRAKYSNRSMPWTVEELLDPSKVRAPVEKADPLAAYRPLLDAGDAERGRKLFHTNLTVRCIACHKVGASGGGFVGPELTDVGKRATREYLLESLIEPSAKIVKGFETLVIMTVDGNVISGTLVSDKDGEITLALPTGGTKTIAAADVDDRMQSNVSSMPPMAAAFTPEQIADLIAYLQTLKPAE